MTRPITAIRTATLAARGQTSPGIRGALHPRWTASLCVASCTNSAAIRAAKRLASPAQRPSRCSGEIIHGLLALAVTLAACSPTEPGEGGEQWDKDEVATVTRSGVKLVIQYHSADEEFRGTMTNTTDSAVSDARVEIHLSNGKELGPTPRTTLAAGESKDVTLDAAREQFSWFSVHVELGGGSG